MPDLRNTKQALQVLSSTPETIRVTKMGMNVLSAQSEEMKVTKMGMQVLSSVEELLPNNLRRSVVVIGG